MFNGRSLTPFFTAAIVAVILLACLMTGLSTAVIGSIYTYQTVLTLTPGVFDMAQMPANPAPLTTGIPATAALPAASGTLSFTATQAPATGTPAPVDTATIPYIFTTIEPTETFTPEPTFTPEATLTPTLTPIPTVTPLPTATPTIAIVDTPTPDPQVVAATETAVVLARMTDMENTVTQLFDTGLITTKTGLYHAIPNYEAQWATRKEYERTSVGYSPKDFILRGKAIWEVDGNRGDWMESGCGVVLRENDKGDHYLVFLSLDGRARLMRSMNGSLSLLGRSTIYDVDRSRGEADFMLVVEDEWLRVFVNGKQKFEKRADPNGGNLSLTVVSGNTYGYGTYCRMNSIDLWEIQK